MGSKIVGAIVMFCIALMLVIYAINLQPSNKVMKNYTITVDSGEVFTICAYDMVYKPETRSAFFVMNPVVLRDAQVVGVFNAVTTITSVYADHCPMEK